MCRIRLNLYFFIFIFFIIFSTISMCYNQSWAKTIDLDSGKEKYDLRNYVDILPDQGWNIDQVSSPEFQSKFTEPEEGFFPGQYPDGVWMRFAVAPNNFAHKIKWFINITPPQPQSFCLYYKGNLPTGKWESQTVGYANNNPKGMNNIFSLPLPNISCPQKYYMKYNAEDALFSPFYLITGKQNKLVTNFRKIFFGLFFGASFSIIIYNLFLFFILKDKSYLFYSLSSTSLAAHYIGINDYLTDIFEIVPTLSVKLSFITVCLFLLFSSLFVRYFMGIKYKSKRPSNNILNAIGIYAVASLLAYLLNFSPKVITIVNSAVGLLAVFTYFTVSVVEAKKQYSPAKLFLIAWFLLLLSFALFAASGLNLLPYSEYYLFFSQCAFLAENMLLSIALAARIKLLTKEKDRAKVEAATKTKVLSSMSHEIRNPVQVISGLNELLDQTDLTSEQREYVDLSINTSTHLNDILNDVLDHSKIEAGLMTLDCYNFNLKTLIELTAKMMTIPAKKKDLDLIVEISDQVPEIINGDSKRLKQILINLLSNAIKFTEQGFVELRVKKNSAKSKNNKMELLFEIQDTGIGISEDEIPELFKSYSQAIKNIVSKYEGTGLGLSISKALVELMDGKIWVESQIGEGTIFYFTIIVGQY